MSDGVDVVICEIGGTVGDIESQPFTEAIRQLRHELGRRNTLFVHVSYVPWIAAAQELKTKPTQHSVKELRAMGIQPDILICRSERPLPDDQRDKIALFCDVDREAVINARDVDTVYHVPLMFGSWLCTSRAISSSACNRCRSFSDCSSAQDSRSWS